MRDQKRINRIIELLRAAWHASPDLRLGQLVANLTADSADTVTDGDIQREIWNREDDAWERAIRAWIGDRQ